MLWLRLRRVAFFAVNFRAMSETSKAVFLSYASQDAEAARRICDALRAAGVEVWLDQEGGLVGGDAWDRKIREQIASCALFVSLRPGAGCEAGRGAEPLMDFANGRNFGNLASAHRLRFKVGSLLIAG